MNHYRAYRREYATACHGDITQALILDQFAFLTKHHGEWFWYSYTQLGEALFGANGTEKKALMRHIDSMKKAGLIEVRSKSGCPNEYRLTEKALALVPDWDQSQNGTGTKLTLNQSQNGSTPVSEWDRPSPKVGPHRSSKGVAKEKSKDTPRKLKPRYATETAC
jgi:hypothetical protein